MGAATIRGSLAETQPEEREKEEHEEEAREQQSNADAEDKEHSDSIFSYAQLAGMSAWVILVSLFYGFLLPTKTTRNSSNVFISLVNGAQLTMTYYYSTKHCYPKLFTEDRTSLNIAYWTLTHFVPICAGYIFNGECREGPKGAVHAV